MLRWQCLAATNQKGFINILNSEKDNIKTRNSLKNTINLNDNDTAGELLASNVHISAYN